MNINRRHFIQNNLICLGSLPVLDKLFNYQSQTRFDLVYVIANGFIDSLNLKIQKYSEKNSIQDFDSISIYDDPLAKNKTYEDRVGIYGYVFYKDEEIATSIDWISSYNISPFIVIDIISDKLKNCGFMVRNKIFTSNRYTQPRKIGIELYK